MSVGLCVCVCVCACVRACACVYVCVLPAHHTGMGSSTAAPRRPPGTGWRTPPVCRTGTPPRWPHTHTSRTRRPRARALGAPPGGTAWRRPTSGPYSGRWPLSRPGSQPPCRGPRPPQAGRRTGGGCGSPPGGGGGSAVGRRQISEVSSTDTHTRTRTHI